MSITVNRKPLSFWEKLYLPAIAGGLKVTARHAWGSLFQGKQVTMEYPEQKWTVPEGYRGAPYLVRDQDGNTKCVSCQLCEFVCPPKAIRIIPPGDSGLKPDRANAENAETYRARPAQAPGAPEHALERGHEPFGEIRGDICRGAIEAWRCDMRGLVL